jgi:predicted ATPase
MRGCRSSEPRITARRTVQAPTRLATPHKGRLLLRQGQSEAAEKLYRKALSIAEEQEAKLWELRAAVSLTRLRRDQGRHAEGRVLLAPIYGWFTEGFDTPDLKEAKGLLDELS